MSAFVSTGQLPRPELVRALVDDAHERFRANTEGETSPVYPALRDAPPDRFGIAVAATSGALHTVGDAEDEFAIMSVSKPFVFALVCDSLGAEQASHGRRGQRDGASVQLHRGGRAKRGRPHQPDGQPGCDRDDEPRSRGGSRGALDLRARGARRASPAGASRSTRRSTPPRQRRTIGTASSREHSTSRGRLGSDPEGAVDLYTRQCCLSVSARDLAVMGATLADGGVNPLTHEQVVSAETCRHALAVMTTAGLYETSGDWLYDVGLPGKSGIGGGIVTVAPGKGGLGTFAPRLDEAGNSVKGQLAARLLSKALGLDLFVSAPAD